MAGTTNKWLMRLVMLPEWHTRLLRVQIDNRCALKVIRYWDSPETTFYLDPTYIHSTRKSKDDYAVEADDNHHRDLVALILALQGVCVLSGYDHPIYWPLDEAGWERIEFKTGCHAAGRNRSSGLQGKGAALAKVPRTEIVWRNRGAVGLGDPLSPGRVREARLRSAA